jgi:tRNA threonylcarbamoyl adenosine modification protein (Sua5/YciO/YrdC/YwlC family)
MRIEINADHPEPRKIARAIAALEAGEVIAYPTDTVYALGCDLANKRAIEALYQIKQMSRDQPLAFVVPDLSEVARYAIVQDFHYRFIKHLIPGPYTFILEATREVPKLVMMKRKTIGIRVPDHAVPRDLTRALGRPILTTSATHPSEGREPIIDPDVIDDRFGRLGVVLDAGGGGVEPSTVIDLTGPEPALVREGAGMDRVEGIFGPRRSLVPELLE